MKTITYQFKAILILITVLLTTSCDVFDSDHNGVGHTEIVQELVCTLNYNLGLREQIINTLNHQEETSFWYGQTITDLYNFFDEWLVFLPTPEDARRYMDAFYDFTESSEGRAVVLKDPFRNWLYNFMMARGRFMDSEASAAILPFWTNDPDLHIENYIIPEDGFQSFNDFFTRRLKPGMRPIASPNDIAILTSPADSTVMKIGDELTSESIITVKGDSMYVQELLGGNTLAEAFIGGRAILCMLSTNDYHRFHSPLSGKIISEAQLAGLYYGMTGGWVDYFLNIAGVTIFLIPMNLDWLGWPVWECLLSVRLNLSRRQAIMFIKEMN